MTQPSQYTADRLEAIRRAKNRARQIVWTAGALVVWILAALGFAFADYRMLLSKTVREGSALLLAGILIFAVIRLWRLIRQPGDAKHTALELESRRPDLGCVVSTATEYLAGQRQATRDYEPELVEALQAQAAKKLHAVETPWYRGKIAAALGVLFLAFAAMALVVWRTPAAGTALGRVTAPWANAAYTRVDVKPGDASVPAGHNLSVLAAFHGRPPHDARLLWRADQSSAWQTAALSPSENGTCSNLIANITGKIIYQVAGGDAVSPQFSITTYNPPEIKSLTTRVDFPAYTKHLPVTETTPDLRVVRGAKLAFHVAASGDIAGAKMCFTNQPPVELTRDANGQWSASMAPRGSFDYRIELTDQAGRKGGNENPYHVVVAPDEPPLVEVVDPEADVRADPTNTVPLRITASDDFAVTAVKLVYHKLGQPEKSIICNATNLNGQEASALTAIDLAPLHLQPYEVVAYHAEASDNNTLDGPGIGKSPVYFIEVTTNDTEVPSESHSQVQKINLLQLEKQIIAATTAAPEEQLGEKLPEVATVQRQTRVYADTFKNSSSVLAAAPPEARAEFDAAINSMDASTKSLDQIQRNPSLASEDDALMHLYQAVRLFPELKPGMCNCTGIKIVAEAIEKKKQAEQKKHDQELPKVIAQAKRVAAAQAQLNGLYRKSAEAAPSGMAKNDGQTPGQNGPGNTGQSPKDGNALAYTPPAANPAETPTPNPGTDEQKPAAGPPSEEQKKLAGQAGELAAKLRELTASDPRISSRHSQHMTEVAGQMRQAGEFAAANNSHAADDTGRMAFGQLEEIVGALEVLANGQPLASDASAEDYPKEYGQQISDYLRTLSYQK
jgi:hypothetical protein